MNLNPSIPEHAEIPLSLGPGRLAWTSLVIAATAIASSILVGWLAYVTSRQAVLDSVAQENLSISRTIINHVEHDLIADGAEGPNHKDPTSTRQQALDQIAAIWNRTDPPYPGSYVCVIEPGGKLALHTRMPEMRGTDVSQVIVDPDSSRPRRVRELLDSQQSLATQNINFRGKSQLVGYAYMPSIDSLVVVHVPSQLVEDNIRKAGIPWIIALTLVAGVLISLSVGLIRHGYLKTHKVALKVSETLIAREQQLQRQFAELELLYRTAPVGLCLVDVDFRFVRINDELAAVHGLPANQHIGRSLREVVPDIADFLEPIYHRAIETGEPERNFDVERADRANPGERLNYLASFFPVKDDEGQVIGVSTVVQDVTDRKRAAAELHLRDHAFASSSNGIVIVDAMQDDLPIIYCNPAFERLTGYTKDELIGRNCRFLQADDRDQPGRAAIRRAVQEGHEVTTTLRNYHKDGTMFWTELQISPVRDAQDRVTHFVGFQNDVTDRKQVEKDLRDSEARFRALFEQAAVGVAQVDSKSGQFLEINQRYCDIVGYSREQMLNMDFATITHPDDLREDLANMSQLIAGEIREFSMEKRYKRKDGDAVWVKLTVSPMWNPGEAATSHIAIVEDITLQRRAQRDLLIRQEAIANSAMPTCFGDDKFRVTYGNQAFLDLFGFESEDQVIGLPNSDFVSPPNSIAEINAELTTRGSWTGELCLRKLDGTPVDSIVCANLLRDQSGNPICSLATFLDITDRKRAEEQLRFTKFSVDSCSMSIFWLRHDASLFYVNDAAAQQFGYSRDELQSMTVHDLDPAYPADVWPEYWQEMQRRRTLTFESQMKHKDGTLVPVEISTNLLEFEGQEFVIAFVTNIAERLRSEEKLQKSEARFRTIFEQAAVGVAQLDTISGTVLRVNRRYCEILGSSEDDLVGKTWMELTHPDDLESNLANVQCMRSGQIRDFSMEKRLQGRDGASVWINLTVSAMWQPGEEPSTHIAIVEDVTERREAELALRESEELFRRLVQTTSFGVQRNDVDGKITYANDALGQIYGVEPEELIGKYVWEFAVDEQARQAMHEYVRRQSSGSPEQPIGFDTKNLTCDGRIIDVFIDWTYDLDAEGKVVGFIVVVADITERKEFERTLEFQADVLNRVSDAVLVSDSAGAVTYANEAAEQLFLGPRLQFKGRKLSELHDELRVSGPTSEDIRAGFDETGRWQGENEFQINHETRSFETSLKRFQAPGSDDRFMVSVVRDISLRKKAEQERRQHRDALAHMTRLSTMGELLAGIAHEVKQPLHAISNYANAASNSLGNVDPARPLGSDQIDNLNECNDGIRKASNMANEIIQRLRAFARKSEQRRENIDINEVVADSIEMVAFEARNSRTTVETAFAAGLPDLLADRIQIEQVVVNLLHNAYEALSECDPPRRVFVRTVRMNRNVEVQVKDSGPGLLSDQHGKLFKAFYTTKNSGMGMGLTISRTIVEDHGGRLWVRNNDTRGLTFHFSLPVDVNGADQSKD